MPISLIQRLKRHGGILFLQITQAFEVLFTSGEGSLSAKTERVHLLQWEISTMDSTRFIKWETELGNNF